MNKNSSFSVPSAMDVQVENFPNSVTGQKREIEMLLPEGLIWILADAAKTELKCIATSSLNYEHTRPTFLLFIGEIQGSVICWLSFSLTKKENKGQVGNWSSNQYPIV